MSTQIKMDEVGSVWIYLDPIESHQHLKVTGKDFIIGTTKRIKSRSF